MAFKTQPRPMTDRQAAIMLWEGSTFILNAEQDGRCTAAQADALLIELLDFCGACVEQGDALRRHPEPTCSNVILFGKRP